MFQGLWTTLKSMFEKPATIQYPEQKRRVHTRFKGRHVLKRYDNGWKNASAAPCARTPARPTPFFVEASENTDEERYSPGDRYASTYEINMLRCIFAVTARTPAPRRPSFLGDNYELSFTSRTATMYTKDLLIEGVPAGGNPTPQKTPPGAFNRRYPRSGPQGLRRRLT